jgi:hypothetical protein
MMRAGLAVCCDAEQGAGYREPIAPPHCRPYLSLTPVLWLQPR